MIQRKGVLNCVHLATESFLARPPEGSPVLSVELHAHSAASHDGRDSIEMLLEQAQAVGLDALVVTDHDEFGASKLAADRAPKYGLVGIPGMEVTSTAGHVLAIGIEDAVPSGLNFAETVDAIRGHGGVSVVPHPFQSSRSGVASNIPRETLARADAIEVYNSRLLTGRANRQAEEFARDYNLPMTAGSDAHIAEMVGQAVTRVNTDTSSLTAILNAVREGETTVEGKRTPWRISLRQAAGGAKRRIKTRLAELR